MSSHYLNQCWNIFNLTIRNKSHWHQNKKKNLLMKMNLKRWSAKWRPYSLGHDVLISCETSISTNLVSLLWLSSSYYKWIKLICEICKCHYDVIKWKHFPCYWPFVRGNSPVTGEFPSQRPVTRIFDVFFDPLLNKRLSKQSWGWWFETPSRSLWHHCRVHAASAVRCRVTCNIPRDHNVPGNCIHNWGVASSIITR